MMGMIAPIAALFVIITVLEVLTRSLPIRDGARRLILLAVFLILAPFFFPLLRQAMEGLLIVIAAIICLVMLLRLIIAII